MSTYVIGVDFGTLSARAVLADTAAGRTAAVCEMAYPHGVIGHHTPDADGRVGNLPQDWAIQDPMDYLLALRETVRQVAEKASIRPEEVVGIGLDATSATILPVDSHLEPLSANPTFQKEKHAYVKLWKHHSATKEGETVTSVALAENEAWLPFYGSNVSCEWVLPKAWEIVKEAPKVYEAADKLMDVEDWLISRMVGRPVCCCSSAGYKALYHEGYPSQEFLRKLDPRLEDFYDQKWPSETIRIGECAGYLTPETAKELGLMPGTAVACPGIDAHSAVLGCGIENEGDLLMIIGTSSCSMISSSKKIPIPGICGSVEGGILPGLYGYEAGQPSCGDTLNWVVKNFHQTHDELTEKASLLKIGESGLLCLDWWNGNRSTLIDSSLSGMILGLTNETRPEEVYRAAMEGWAMGARVIVEHFEKYGIPVKKVYVTGGVALKNALLLQILADVLEREVCLVKTPNASALGAAMMADAAFRKREGHGELSDTIRRMDPKKTEGYTVIPPRAKKGAYEASYRRYVDLYEYFGRTRADIMHGLKKDREHEV